MLGIVWMRTITCQGSGLARMVSLVGDLRGELTAELAHPRAFVDELRRLDADGRESPGQLRGNGGKCLVQVGQLVRTGENAAGAAHELDLGRAPPGQDQRLREPGQSRVVRPSEGSEAAAIPHDAFYHPLVHGRATEPQRRSTRPERLRLDPHVAEPVVPPLETHRGAGPGSRPDLKLLVENGAAASERNPQRVVF